MALTYTPVPDQGALCPDFSLPGVDGKTHSRRDIQTGTPFLIMFICNHCPYVKAIEDRLAVLGMDLKKEGIPVFAISSNDAADYPEDSFENMKLRAKQKNYVFPYLYDESQSVAKAFGAVCTPDFFLYDSKGRLQYRGRLDDSWKDPSKVTRRELFEAALKLKAGAPAPEHQPPSMGCSIKWKES